MEYLNGLYFVSGEIYLHNEVVINNHKGDIIADDGVYNMKFKCLFVVFIEKYFRKYFISKMCETRQQHHFEYLFVYYAMYTRTLCALVLNRMSGKQRFYTQFFF